MTNSMPAILLGSLIVLSSGCASFTRPMDSEANKGPKVLFEWAEAKDKDESKDDKKESKDDKKDDAEPEKKQANGMNGNAESDDDAEPDEIVTDRPDFTEASSTVGKGRIQLEAGYTFFRDRTNGEKFSVNSCPEALLRIGMFADWFELRLGQNFVNERTTLVDGSREQVNGAQDLYLGVKLGLTEQKAWRPEMALVLQTTVPTGASGVTNGEMLPGINLLYGWDVIKDRISIGGSTQANRARGEFPLFDPAGLNVIGTGKHSYLLLAQSMTVGYTLTPKLGAYTEWFALIPSSAIGPDIGPEHYFDGGFTYKVTPLFQLDIRAGVGLNDHAVDYFVGSGFAVKY
ncbi:MAG: transporter [Planctomycetes bacterium]|nr:transporter [Planctomycetota bacterium]